MDDSIKVFGIKFRKTFESNYFIEYQYNNYSWILIKHLSKISTNVPKHTWSCIRNLSKRDDVHSYGNSAEEVLRKAMASMLRDI